MKRNSFFNRRSLALTVAMIWIIIAFLGVTQQIEARDALDALMFSCIVWFLVREKTPDAPKLLQGKGADYEIPCLLHDPVDIDMSQESGRHPD